MLQRTSMRYNWHQVENLQNITAVLTATLSFYEYVYVLLLKPTQEDLRQSVHRFSSSLLEFALSFWYGMETL